MTREQAIELARRVRNETIASGEHVEVIVDDSAIKFQWTDGNCGFDCNGAFITYEWVLRAIMAASK